MGSKYRPPSWGSNPEPKERGATYGDVTPAKPHNFGNTPSSVNQTEVAPGEKMVKESSEHEGD